MGRWHADMQNLFSKTSGSRVLLCAFRKTTGDKETPFADVCVDETVVEYQHSRITRKKSMIVTMTTATSLEKQ